MKNYFLLLFAVTVFGFSSCKKDNFVDEITESSSTEAQKRNRTSPLDDVRIVSSWLKFQNQQHFNDSYEYLESIREDQADPVVLTPDQGDGYGASYDDDPALAAVENQLGFLSLRKSLQVQEDDLLRDGGDPNDILNSLVDRNITLSSERALWSPDFVVQIGDEIRYYHSSSLAVVIKDNVPLMESILTNGIGEIYKAENLGYAKIKRKKKGANPNDFPCTGTFNVVEGGYADGGKKEALRSFIWNNGDASGAKDLEIVWDWGDGTTETGNNPTASHLYENLAANPTTNTFNVCINVTYKIEKMVDGEIMLENCSQSSCITVHINLPEVDEEQDYCDELSVALAAIDLFDDPFEYQTTAGNEQEVCITLSGLSAILVNLGIDGNYTYQWNFQGQEGEGILECFDTPCNSSYLFSLEIFDADGNSCVEYPSRYHHNPDASCEGVKDFDRGWTFEDGYFSVMVNGNLMQFRTEVWGKHETNKDDFWNHWPFDVSPNQVEAKMKHYEVIDNKWKKSNLHHKIHFSGNVYPQGNGCDCGGTPQFMDDVFQDLVIANCKFEAVRPIFEGQDNGGQGIFCLTTDPYFIHYTTYLWDVERTVQTLKFP